MKRIGIVGGGQLGKMLTLEAKKLGFFVSVLDPTVKSPAGQVADSQIVADFKDEEAIEQLAKQSDFLTFEIELANSEFLEYLQKKGVYVNPSPQTLTMIRDKLTQKQFLQSINASVAPFASIESEADLQTAVQNFGFPLMLKARTGSYDGRGNFLIKDKKAILEGLNKLAGRQLYVEKFIPFIKELAVIIARDMKNNIAIYPIVETVHKRNICQLVYAPAPINRSAMNRAVKLATSIAKHLKGAGVFAIEMFLDKKGHVYINEIAPRVHNSGHFSIEACETSQFEQQIRAITGLSLGSTKMKVPAAVMVNILGERDSEAKLEGLEKALAIDGVSVHIYGKREVRIDRKMGHITAIGQSLEQAYKKARRAREYIRI